MIRCRLHHLEARCRQRGYTLDEVRPCIVSQDGDSIVVDETHSSYPHAKDGPPAARQPVPVPTPAGGAGTELKKLLAKIGITASPNCSCSARARTMDENGTDWCQANIGTIVGWLREEATKRGLPFIDLAGRTLVKRAIANAKRQSGQSPRTA